MLLCALGLCRTKPEKLRELQSFCGATLSLFYPAMQKFAMPQPTSRGLQFFRLSPQAYLLTGAPIRSLRETKQSPLKILTFISRQIMKAFVTPNEVKYPVWGADAKQIKGKDYKYTNNHEFNQL